MHNSVSLAPCFSYFLSESVVFFEQIVGQFLFCHGFYGGQSNSLTLKPHVHGSRNLRICLQDESEEYPKLQFDLRPHCGNCSNMCRKFGARLERVHSAFPSAAFIWLWHHDRQ